MAYPATSMNFEQQAPSREFSGGEAGESVSLKICLASTKPRPCWGCTGRRSKEWPDPERFRLLRSESGGGSASVR